MKAIQMMLQNDLSLRKALSYAGWSRCAYYYEPRRKKANPDPIVPKMEGPVQTRLSILRPWRRYPKCEMIIGKSSTGNKRLGFYFGGTSLKIA